MKKGIVLAITAGIVMSIVLSCDPKMMKDPAAEAVQPAAEAVQKDPAAAGAVAAAEAVQKEVMAIQTDVDAVITILGESLGDLNASAGGVDQAKAKKAQEASVAIGNRVEKTGDTGLIKLAEMAVTAAKKLKDSKEAKEAVKAAEALTMKLSTDTTKPGPRMTISTEIAKFGAVTRNITQQEQTGATTAANTVKTEVDALKKLADNAVKAAKAVK